MGRFAEQFCCCLHGCSKVRPTRTHILLLLLLQTKYVVLTRTDINRRQQEVIDAVTSVLGISSEDAGRILRKYKWWVQIRSRSTCCCQLQLIHRVLLPLSACRDANRVNEEWFTDMDKVRAAVGMVDEAPEPEGSTEKVKAGTAAAAAEAISPSPACMGAASTGGCGRQQATPWGKASKPAAAAMRTAYFWMTIPTAQQTGPRDAGHTGSQSQSRHLLHPASRPSSLRSACSDHSLLCLPVCTTRVCCLLRSA